MSRRTRITLMIVGLLLIGISVAALVYVFTPVTLLRESSPLAPTLFTLPAGGSP